MQQPETVSERVAVVLARLYAGRAMTTAEVAELTGLTARGALYMMNRLCRVQPLVLDDGRWQMCQQMTGAVAAIAVDERCTD
jgi:alkylated DNA nucleotide flippase Atl1